MVTSMIHPDGDLVWNLSASMERISVLLEPKATTLTIATAKQIKVNTYMHGGNQYVAVFSGLGGWAGIGFAAGLTGDTDGLGAVGAYKSLSKYTSLGGVMTVFSLD